MGTEAARRRLGLLVLAFAVFFAATLPGANSAHWASFGGDAGRSGHQPVDPGAVPVTALWQAVGPNARETLTSVVITGGGGPTTQRVAFGTLDGRVHIRRLSDGAVIGADAGEDVSTAPDAFGTDPGNGIGFVDSSTATDLGQLFVLHNDEAGISVAQLDLNSGGLVQDVAVGVAAGYKAVSSPLLGPPDAFGARGLFFVAANADGATGLFRVPITNASQPGALIGQGINSGEIGANVIASPALAYLTTPATTIVEPYVLVGTVNGEILSWSAADPSMQARGPTTADLIIPGIDPLGLTDVPAVVGTPSIPVTANGVAPGAPGSGVTKAPVIYVTGDDGGATMLFKLVQAADGTFAVTASDFLTGLPSKGIATNQIATDAPDEARVFVPTDQNLYSLKTTDLTVAAKVAEADDLAAGTTGYSRTVPVVTGNLLLIATDGGQQEVRTSEDLKKVSDADFFPSDGTPIATAAVGQPAVSHSIAVYGTQGGVFAYRMRTAAAGGGYWFVARDGGVFTFGSAVFHGSAGGVPLVSPIVGMAARPNGDGYWLAAADGGIFNYGGATFKGAAAGRNLRGQAIGIAATATGEGYWIATSAGEVEAFGDAVDHGDKGGEALNRPIVGIAATPTGKGYWLVASDGGIFTFGDARFLGSTGAIRLNQPIVGMAASPTGQGYWLVASDGGIFSYGDATFHGSTGAIRLNRPVVAMTATPSGDGYQLIASDGGVFSFGDAGFFGSTGNIRLNQPIVGGTGR